MKKNETKSQKKDRLMNVYFENVDGIHLEYTSTDIFGLRNYEVHNLLNQDAPIKYITISQRFFDTLIIYQLIAVMKEKLKETRII